jgi:hypothetical protein
MSILMNPIIRLTIPKVIVTTVSIEAEAKSAFDKATTRLK